MVEHPLAGAASAPLLRGPFTRLDHVGIAVWDADAVVPYYRDTLGMELVGDELADEPGTRLVYFQAGEAFVQLVQPVAPDCDLREWLAEYGEGLHHFCLVVADLASAAGVSAEPGEVTVFKAGRRRNACFLNGVVPPSVRIEVTEAHPSR
jgi:methylmalonyl-CoA/ethylmalonyl-CoA epimerase